MTGSLYFEDLEVGQRFVSHARTVTEADVVGFAGLSGDFNPIHMDQEFAARGMFGRRVAHGLLGISIATGMIDNLGLFRASMGAMLGIDGWTFKAPLYIGDTIHLEMSIETKRLTKAGDRGVVQRRVQLVNQGDVVVQEGLITVLILCRGASADPVRSAHP